MFDLPNLAPFLMQPGSPGMVGQAMGDVAQSIAQERAKQQQAQQFAAHQQFLQQSLASEDQRAAAQLAEQHGYHGASLDIEQQQLDAAQRQQQAKAIQGALDTAIKTGDPSQIDALAPLLQMLGVKASPEQAQNPLPSLAAFAGLPGGSEIAPQPTGRYNFSAGGKDLGGPVDVKGIVDARAAQTMKLAEALQQSNVPGEAPYRNPVIAAFAQDPSYLANPQQLVKDVGEATDNPLQRRQSGINATEMRGAQTDRYGATLEEQRFKEANERVWGANGVVARAQKVYDDKGVKASLAAADEIERLASNGSGGIDNQIAILKAIRASGMSRMNQTEIGIISRSAGLEDLTETGLNRVFGHAELSRGQRNQLIKLARTMKMVAQKQQTDIANYVQHNILGDTTIGRDAPQYQKQWADDGVSAITGTFGEDTPVAPAPSDAGGGSGSGASVTLKGPPAAAASGGIDGLLDKYDPGGN